MSCCRINVKFVVFLLSFSIVIIYILIGALIFQAIEKPNEERNREKAKVTIEMLLKDVTEKFKTELNDTEACWLAEVLSFSEEEAEKEKEGRMGDWSSTWRFWKTLRFCFVVVTTIGYGDMVPVTHLGKGITMIFALTGIPVYWMLISSYSSHLFELLKYLVNRVTKDKSKAYILEQLISGSLFFTIFILFTMVMFIIEKWNFGTALWFSVISITTIGFGDITPTTGDPGTVLAFIFLMTLCFVTLSLFVQTQIDHFFKLHRMMVKLCGVVCGPCCNIIEDVQVTRIDTIPSEVEVEEYDMNQV